MLAETTHKTHARANTRLDIQGPVGTLATAATVVTAATAAAADAIVASVGCWGMGIVTKSALGCLSDNNKHKTKHACADRRFDVQGPTLAITATVAAIMLKLLWLLQLL